MPSEKNLLDKIQVLALSTSPSNAGDIYVQAVELYSQINSGINQQLADLLISGIRSHARGADIGWKLFNVPPKPLRSLSDEEYFQLFALISTLHGFCYGVERLDEASFVTGSDSPPVRFYINSVYHYIAALFLLNKGNDNLGGMVYKTLAPVGLSNLLDPIETILNKQMDEGISFGETIKIIRNKFLVHGTFSPTDISSLVKRTHLRELNQRLRLTKNIWALFNQAFILKLKLIAMLTSSNIEVDGLTLRYIETIDY